MRKVILILVLFCFAQVSNGQTEDAWVYFTNKPNETIYLNNPLLMLSQRSIDRRTKQTISIDSKDVPLEISYYNQVKNATGITIKAKSKWLNAVHVIGTQTDISNLASFPFVQEIIFANSTLNPSSKSNYQKSKQNHNDKLKITTNFNYGNAANQIQQIKGDVLHQNNFTGAGIQIAVIDAGFPNVNTFTAFDRIKSNGQILGGYDFVNRNSNFYTGYYHGMSVLSTIAGYIDGQFVGTAPDANFYLFITEDYNNESPLEESLWVEAAEKADSLGVDIINTSLGYSTFDKPEYDYTYNDMDGSTTFISRGAEIAFSRGMIVVNSAGNEGNGTWHYITAPADAPSVLSIGAVDATGTIASFSSYGPTFDGRIKPDVCAQGASVYIINSVGNVATSNGTSFASPVMAGIIACLWQAFPTKTNTEIINSIKQNGHLFANPTNQEGYGIPNFETIFNTLSINDLNASSEVFFVYPNPSSQTIRVNFPTEVYEVTVTLASSLGVNLLMKKINKQNPSIDISNLSNGLYFLTIKDKNQSKTLRIFKN